MLKDSVLKVLILYKLQSTLLTFIFYLDFEVDDEHSNNSTVLSKNEQSIILFKYKNRLPPSFRVIRSKQKMNVHPSEITVITMTFALIPRQVHHHNWSKGVEFFTSSKDNFGLNFQVDATASFLRVLAVGYAGNKISLTSNDGCFLNYPTDLSGKSVLMNVNITLHRSMSFVSMGKVGDEHPCRMNVDWHSYIAANNIHDAFFRLHPDWYKQPAIVVDDTELSLTEFSVLINDEEDYEAFSTNKDSTSVSLFFQKRLDLKRQADFEKFNDNLEISYCCNERNHISIQNGSGVELTRIGRDEGSSKIESFLKTQNSINRLKFAPMKPGDNWQQTFVFSSATQSPVDELQLGNNSSWIDHLTMFYKGVEGMSDFLRIEVMNGASYGSKKGYFKVAGAVLAKLTLKGFKKPLSLVERCDITETTYEEAKSMKIAVVIEKRFELLEVKVEWWLAGGKLQCRKRLSFNTFTKLMENLEDNEIIFGINSTSEMSTVLVDKFHSHILTLDSSSMMAIKHQYSTADSEKLQIDESLRPLPQSTTDVKYCGGEAVESVRQCLMQCSVDSKFSSISWYFSPDGSDKLENLKHIEDWENVASISTLSQYSVEDDRKKRTINPGDVFLCVTTSNYGFSKQLYHVANKNNWSQGSWDSYTTTDQGPGLKHWQIALIILLVVIVLICALAGICYVVFYMRDKKTLKKLGSRSTASLTNGTGATFFGPEPSFEPPQQTSTPNGRKASAHIATAGGVYSSPGSVDVFSNDNFTSSFPRPSPLRHFSTPTIPEQHRPDVGIVIQSISKRETSCRSIKCERTNQFLNLKNTPVAGRDKQNDSDEEHYII